MTEDNNINNNGEVRSDLREAGDALLAAGSALGAAFGKFAEGLPEKLKGASESARETLNNATSEGEVRTLAANFTNEAEKVFNQLRERDLQFTDETKAKLRESLNDIRASFDERMAKAGEQAEGEAPLDDLRTRFDALFDSISERFRGQSEAEPTESDIIDGEIVDER